MTAAVEGGEWSAARPGRTLPPGKTRYPFYRRLVGPQGLSRRAENLVSTGIRSWTVQSVVSRYTDWATRPTRCTKVSNLFYFRTTLYMFRTVFPFIIRSSRLYIQQQAYVKQQTAVSVWHMPVAVCTILNSWWWTETPSETCRVSF